MNKFEVRVSCKTVLGLIKDKLTLIEKEFPVVLTKTVESLEGVISDEWLLKISFPTGAYFLIDGSSFDKPYLSELFNKMLEEFLALNPKYVDRLNKSMYFTSDNTKEVLDTEYEITTKYKNLVGDELKKLKIEKLKAELEALNGANT